MGLKGVERMTRNQGLSVTAETGALSKTWFKIGCLSFGGAAAQIALRTRSDARRRYLDDLASLNQLKLDDYQDPEISTRIAQYEMAFRMQASAPELMWVAQRLLSQLQLWLLV